MTIKELAHSAQQLLQASTGSPLKRALIYELLAASFGLKSYAALGIDTVFTQLCSDDKRTGTYSDFVRRRCIELGYPPEAADLITVSLASFLAERQIGVVQVSALISQLQVDWSSLDDNSDDDCAENFDNDQDDGPCPQDVDGDQIAIEPLMLEGLEAAASKGSPLAHYALALIHAPDDDDDSELEPGGSYWHTQAQQGQVLTGVKKEWADAYAARLTEADKYAHHLREAARLGNQDALLDVAERFGDPSFFEGPRRDVRADPSAIAEIAERLGRVVDAKHWLTVAAENGDTDAMLRLIEEHDQGDLARCWTWVYLSRLVGTDLCQDTYYAINEDGSDYDDDVGGPAYAAGRHGIDLAPISAEQDAAAKQAAQRLFEKMQRAAAVEPRR